MYAILDLESTGGKYGEEAITEVAIYKFDGEEIVDQFGSLVNPERKIQPYVIKLTGINNDMLRYAPKFYEVAKRVIEITKDCTLVAHNVKFDYHLLQIEFERLGYPYKRKTLCTVELSKNLIPGLHSYSLGKLVKSLGIPITNRHRAFGDALATVKLFKLLLGKDTDKKIIRTALSPGVKHTDENLPLKIIDDLPTEMGICYFHDKKGKIIFLSKSSNIKRKVSQYFTRNSLKAKLIQKEVDAVSYELTGNKLIATLKENEELKKLKPRFNDLPQKTAPFLYGLYQIPENTRESNLQLKEFHTEENLITPFKNLNQAYHFIKKLEKEYDLAWTNFNTGNLLQSREAQAPFSSSSVETPAQAAISEKDKVAALTTRYSLNEDNIVLVGPGRQPAEKSVLLIEDGVFKGVAYIDLNYQLNHLKTLHSLLIPMTDSPYARLVIRNFFQKDLYKRIPFPW